MSLEQKMHGFFFSVRARNEQFLRVMDNKHTYLRKAQRICTLPPSPRRKGRFSGANPFRASPGIHQREDVYLFPLLFGLHRHKQSIQTVGRKAGIMFPCPQSEKRSAFSPRNSPPPGRVSPKARAGEGKAGPLMGFARTCPSVDSGSERSLGRVRMIETLRGGRGGGGGGGGGERESRGERGNEGTCRVGCFSAIKRST